MNLLKIKTHSSSIPGEKRNLLIYSENFKALQLLKKKYAQKIKCIYLDPPYNTKQTFLDYKDNQTSLKWLSEIKGRLLLMKNFLTKDGSIWISIDDKECHYLKVACDDIFERKNFVANVIWERKRSPQNCTNYLSANHEHILVYARNKSIWRPNLLPRTEKMDAAYQNPDNDPRGRWRGNHLSVKKYTPNTIYPITTPSGRIVNPPSRRSWSLLRKRFDEYLKENRLWFGKDGNLSPVIKTFLSEVRKGRTPMTIFNASDVGSTQKATFEARLLNPNNPFSKAKPEGLLERIIHLASKTNDIILDAFAGSGTTGAVAHKMHRRWIMIEREESYYNHALPRLQKVISGEDPGGVTKKLNWKGGGGFEQYYCMPFPNKLFT